MPRLIFALLFVVVGAVSFMALVAWDRGPVPAVASAGTGR